MENGQALSRTTFKKHRIQVRSTPCKLCCSKSVHFFFNFPFRFQWKWIGNDDDVLFRYLRAREFNIELSMKLLLSTLKWRDEFGTWNVADRYENELRKEMDTGKIYRSGKDKFGRPILYLRNRHQNTKDPENQMRFLAYVLELATHTMDITKGVEKWVIVIDFKGQTWSNTPSLSITKQTIDILLTHFPERLGVAFFVDFPKFFQVIWSAVQPFLTETTRQKIRFVGGPPESIYPAMADVIDDDQIEKEFGGKADVEWNAHEYWKVERQQLKLHQKNEAKLAINEVKTTITGEQFNDDELSTNDKPVKKMVKKQKNKIIEEQQEEKEDDDNNDVRKPNDDEKSEKQQKKKASRKSNFEEAQQNNQQQGEEKTTKTKMKKKKLQQNEKQVEEQRQEDEEAEAKITKMKMKKKLEQNEKQVEEQQQEDEEEQQERVEKTTITKKKKKKQIEVEQEVEDEEQKTKTKKKQIIKSQQSQPMKKTRTTTKSNKE